VKELMMGDEESLPPLEDCGFVRVPADEPLWMTCEKCGKSDHFWLTEDEIRCRCGARYSHAVRPDGESVPRGELVAVPFAKGPVQLADLEWDPKRLGVIAAVVLSIVAALGWLLLG
jgi:hypothetical protein